MSVGKNPRHAAGKNTKGKALETRVEKPSVDLTSDHNSDENAMEVQTPVLGAVHEIGDNVRTTNSHVDQMSNQQLVQEEMVTTEISSPADNFAVHRLDKGYVEYMSEGDEGLENDIESRLPGSATDSQRVSNSRIDDDDKEDDPHLNQNTLVHTRESVLNRQVSGNGTNIPNDSTESHAHNQDDSGSVNNQTSNINNQNGNNQPDNSNNEEMEPGGGGDDPYDPGRFIKRNIEGDWNPKYLSQIVSVMAGTVSPMTAIMLCIIFCKPIFHRFIWLRNKNIIWDVF